MSGAQMEIAVEIQAADADWANAEPIIERINACVNKINEARSIDCALHIEIKNVSCVSQGKTLGN